MPPAEPKSPPRLIKAFLTAGLLLAAACLTASMSAAEKLTWERVLERAAEGNPELEASRARISASKARYKAARGAYFPQLSAEAGYQRRSQDGGGGRRADSEEDVSDTFRSEGGSRSDYSTGLTLEQAVFSGFGDVARVAQAEAAIMGSEAELSKADADLTFSLKQALSDLIYSQSLGRLSRSIVQRRRDNRELVMLRYEGGREHKGSFLRSEAQLESAEFDEAQAVRQAATAARSLLTLMGVSGEESIETDGTLRAGAPPPAGSLEELAGATPQVAAAEAGILGAAAALRIARSPSYPSVTANGTFGRRDDQFFPDEEDWTAGVSVRVPLYTGGRITQEIRAAEQDMREARANRDAELLRSVRTLQEAYQSYVDAYERQRVQAAFVEAATLRSEIARSQYTSGLLTYENWDIIENDLITAERSALQSRRDAVVAEARWRQAKGEGEILQ